MAANVFEEFWPSVKLHTFHRGERALSEVGYGHSSIMVRSGSFFGQEATMDDRKHGIAPKLQFFAGLTPLALLFIVGGLLHFVFPQVYLRIMPPLLPWPRILIAVSGAAEIAGGVGLLIARFRQAAAYCLALLLVAVFPANVYMAIAHVPFPGVFGESWVQWLRLPLQIPIILWALHYRRQ